MGELTTRCARGAGRWGRGKTPGSGGVFFSGAAFVVATRCARGAYTPPVRGSGRRGRGKTSRNGGAPPLRPRVLLVRGAGTPPLCLLLRGARCGSFFGAAFAAGVGVGTPRRGAGTLPPPFFFERGGAFVCARAAFLQHARRLGENAGFLGVSPRPWRPPPRAYPGNPSSKGGRPGRRSPDSELGGNGKSGGGSKCRRPLALMPFEAAPATSNKRDAVGKGCAVYAVRARCGALGPGENTWKRWCFFFRCRVCCCYAVRARCVRSPKTTTNSGPPRHPPLQQVCTV